MAERESTTARFEDYALFIGGAKDDRHSGSNTFKDVAFGRAGDDGLGGRGRDDDLLGGKGDDRLTGDGGMDHLDGGWGDDRLDGGAMNDNLVGAGGKDRLDEGPGHGNLEGGPGNDTLSGGRGADAFVVDPDSGHDKILDFRAGSGMFDHLALLNIAPEELRFEDTPAGVKIAWNEGKGSVLLAGVDKGQLAQDDFMFTDDKQLVPVGGTKGDFHLASDEALGMDAAPIGSEGVTAVTGTDRTFHFDEFHVQFGGDGRDELQGGGLRDFFFGLGGDDGLTGNGGDDDLHGDGGADDLAGGAGMDHLTGGDGQDRLDGGDDMDHLAGGAGKDEISAGAGHDMIEGGMGDDALDGGDGADAFVVDPHSGHDVIRGGFTAGPGAFDHIAFIDIFPEQVEVEDAGDRGAHVTWGSGSVLIEGVRKSDLAQDDFMFNDKEGGGFVSDRGITFAGSDLIFPPNADSPLI